MNRLCWWNDWGIGSTLNLLGDLSHILPIVERLRHRFHSLNLLGNRKLYPADPEPAMGETHVCATSAPLDYCQFHPWIPQTQTHLLVTFVATVEIHQQWPGHFLPTWLDTRLSLFCLSAWPFPSTLSYLFREVFLYTKFSTSQAPSLPKNSLS